MLGLDYDTHSVKAWRCSVAVITRDSDELTYRINSRNPGSSPGSAFHIVGRNFSIHEKLPDTITLSFFYAFVQVPSYYETKKRKRKGKR